MKLKFDPDQPHQLQAIEAVAGLFTGQPRIEADLRFALGQSSFAAVANRLDLTRPDLLANLQAIQRQNGISPDSELYTIDQTIDTAAGPRPASFYNFTVEMETGTGKTYVYTRTALELYRRYGMRKYIVVVPSVAIREGVLKSLEITKGDLLTEYGNPPYRFYTYDSANLSDIRQFSTLDSIEIMIMTLASFNKAANVIRQSTDRLQGETPVHLVQAARPILILDEPQNMESDLSVRSLALLDPLFALRYSATPRNPYNIVYRLTPFAAYRQELVKRIQVTSTIREGETSRPYLRLDSITSQKRTFTARIAVHALTKAGTVQERVITVRPGTSLREATNRPEYAGYDVEELDVAGQRVLFTNGQEIARGQELGADREAIFREQIRYTVREHLKRQRSLRKHGLKVLSLFFIDRVANYRTEDGQPGLIRHLFDQAYDEARAGDPDWPDRPAAEVQAGYFAQHRTRTGQVVLEDSHSGETEADRDAYNLIMKAKERLLSFDEPVAFIFSHSALREGWDNPNVFQICTLNQTASPVKKRQEVGRGIRLAVNQQGERVRDPSLNVLTVVANESYDRFVAGLQSEIALEYQQEIEERCGKSIADLTDEERAKLAEEYGEGIIPPRPPQARDRVAVTARKEYLLKPEFKELWERIARKTRYAVKIDSERLIQDVVRLLSAEEIRPPRITITKARVEVTGESAFEAMQVAAARTVASLAGRYPLPNLLDIMANLMEHTTPPIRLTRRTLLEIIRRASPDVQRAMVDNPNEFATVAVRLIKERLADQLVEGVQYTRLDEWYEMTQLEEPFESWRPYLVACDHSVYDHVLYDSEPERQFAQGLDHNDQVLLYLKLPSWFTVPTPVGEYNPDWAIVWQDRDEHGDPTGRPLLYLVRETKPTRNRALLRDEERRKVNCGERHFDALCVDYDLAVTVADLP